MSILVALFFIIVLLILLAFIIALKVRLMINTDTADLNMSIFWMPPFIKVLITIENFCPFFTLFLFNSPILKKQITGKSNRQGKLNLVKIVKPEDVHINFKYGFRDPYITGITCGAVHAASQFINIDTFYHFPNFITDNDYIYLDASAKINSGKALMNLIKAKLKT